MSILDEFHRFCNASQMKRELVLANSSGEMVEQFYNPTAEADYKAYLARQNHIQHEEGDPDDAMD